MNQLTGFGDYGDTDILSMFTSPPPLKSQVQVNQLRRQPQRSSTSLSQNPEAGTAVTNPVQDRINALETERAEVLKQQEAAWAKPDYSSYEQLVQQKQQDKKGGLLLALASQAAGKEYAPFQAHYLKQAASASDPTKVTGGMVSASGFQEDVGYAQELAAKRADARIKQIDGLLQQNVSMQERARLEAEKREQQIELRQMMIDAQRAMAAQASADRRYAADLASQDRAAARALAGGGKLSGEEAAAQGYLHRMRAAEAIMDDPALGLHQAPTGPEILGGFLPGIGPEAANLMRGTNRQQVYQAQEDWVRAKLRKESGAVIGDEEMRREIRTYFPLLTDRPEVVEQKRLSRLAAERQLEMMGGTYKRNLEGAPNAGAPGQSPQAAPAPASVQQRARSYYD